MLPANIWLTVHICQADDTDIKTDNNASLEGEGKNSRWVHLGKAPTRECAASE